MMSWLTVLALLHSTADQEPPPTGTPAVELAISPRLDGAGRWCSGPVFQASVRNPGPKPVWLELGAAGDDVDVSSQAFRYELPNSKMGGAARILHHDFSVNVKSDNWGSIELLRGPEATLLRPGESVTRIAKPDEVRLRSGKVEVELSIRIHGTQDLKDAKVHTYEPHGTLRFDLRRRGRCFEVRRLTGR